VKFEAEIDLAAGLSRCNCSLCTKTSWSAAIIKPDALRVLAGESEVAMYEWGYKVSKRYFCPRCGIHCFGRGHLAELGGDYVSINVNCLDGVELSGLKVIYWDGRHDNWDAGPRDTPWPAFAA
jgi:hypothetical protein